MMRDYLTLFGTAINKQPRQLMGIGKRIIKSNTLPRLPINIDARYERKIPNDFEPVVQPIRANTINLQKSTAERRDKNREKSKSAAAGELTFLNKSVTFSSGEAITMDASKIMEQSLHWQLKCWGFEHLEWTWLGYDDPQELSEKEIAVHKAWIKEWQNNYPIAGDPQYLRQYWMPHSVCLRILNWIRYDALFYGCLDSDFRKQILEFVYKNSLFLSDNVEYGVGGNHLIENAVALIIAGVYFDNRQWRKQGRKILNNAASEQFFADGGHVERSPMYHLLMCQRFLTAYDTLSHTGVKCQDIRKVAHAATEFIKKIRPPDDTIPLLNDSVFFEGLRLTECLKYAESVGITTTEVEQMKTSPHTGYYWLENQKERFLIPAHEVAVPHIPGHAHVHPGHFCFWVNETRVFTDTGVYGYLSGKRRANARSIRSHNTVQVADKDPVHTGSSFWLWGQINPVVEYEPDETKLRMSYSVNNFGVPSYSHERTVSFKSGSWMITDSVRSQDFPVINRLHVHPDCEAKFEKEQAIVKLPRKEKIIQITSSGWDEISIKTRPYYPEFGKEVPRDVLTFKSENSGSFSTSFKSQVKSSEEKTRNISD